MKESDPSFKIFKCDNCDYTASTSTVLKRHKTSKHKVKAVSKEKEGGGKIENAVHPSKSLEKQPEKVGMPNLTIPPFKHPDPDRNNTQES